MRFGQKSFFNSISSFSPHWDYERHDEYFGEKVISLSTRYKVHSKSYVFDESVLNGVRPPII